MKKFYLLLFAFLSLKTWSQTAVYGDVFFHNNGIAAFHNHTVHFVQGDFVTEDTQPGFVIFSSTQAQAQQTHHSSHADLAVMSHNHSDFIFPVGQGGVYQPLSITEGDNPNLIVRFQHTAHDDLGLPSSIDFISNEFYWQVEGAKTAYLGLHWNPFSLLTRLTNHLEDLTILGHTSTGWEVIPSRLAPYGEDGISPTSLEAGQLVSQSKVSFDRYDALTIGGVRKELNILVSEGITPNGDRINDTWYIGNIERYPDVSIYVYNRWGGEVFSHQGPYNNDWNGTYKNNTQLLPEAPYYYRIDLDNDGSIDQEGWIYINY